jgi:hypothetical protein
MISAAELQNVRCHKMQLKFYAFYTIVSVIIEYKHLIYARSVRDLVPVAHVIVLCVGVNLLQVTSWYVELLRWSFSQNRSNQEIVLLLMLLICVLVL